MDQGSIENPVIITRVSEKNLAGLQQEAERVGIEIQVLGSGRQGDKETKRARKGRVFIRAQARS